MTTHPLDTLAGITARNARAWHYLARHAARRCRRHLALTCALAPLAVAAVGYLIREIAR